MATTLRLMKTRRRLAVGALLASAALVANFGANAASAPKTLSIELLPAGDIVIQGDPATDVGLSQQLVVIAHDDDGFDRDVTGDARFTLDDASIAKLDGPGLLGAEKTGTTRVTVSFTDPHGTPFTVARSLTVDSSKGRAGASSTAVRVTLSPSAWKPAPTTNGDPPSQHFVAMVDYADGTREDATRTLGIRDVEPGTDDPSSLADVSAAGLVRALAAGKLDVFVDAGGGVTHRVPVSVSSTAAAAPAPVARTAAASTAAAAAAAYSGEPLKSSTNLIDQAAYQTLMKRGIEPAPLAANGEFLRRVYCDIVGRFPTEQEIDEFLAAPSRAALIDKLLASPEYGRHWGMDILPDWLCLPARIRSADDVTLLEPEPMLAQIVRTDLPLDDLVRRLAKAENPGQGKGDIAQAFGEQFPNYYSRVDRLIETFAGNTSKCARCHDHPLTSTKDDPRWTQMQNYGLYAFFTNNGRANLIGRDGKPLIDPVTGKPKFAVPAFVLDGAKSPPTPPASTATLAARREAFGDLLAESNAFHRATAHRIWAELTAPLLDPNQFTRANLDAVRAPLVLDALTKVFKGRRASLKGFIRYCVTSKLYQLTTKGTTTANDRFLARHTVRRLHGAVIDAGLDRLARQPIEADRVFRVGFGCADEREAIDERTDAVNLLQPLLLMNSRTGARRFAAQVKALATEVDTAKKTRAEAVRSLYRQLIGRPPTSAEQTLVLDKVKTLPTLTALEDVAVALATSVEFVGR